MAIHVVCTSDVMACKRTSNFFRTSQLKVRVHAIWMTCDGFMGQIKLSPTPDFHCFRAMTARYTHCKLKSFSHCYLFADFYQIFTTATKPEVVLVAW
jgi:hypothetical protein